MIKSKLTAIIIRNVPESVSRDLKANPAPISPGKGRYKEHGTIN